MPWLACARHICGFVMRPDVRICCGQQHEQNSSAKTGVGTPIYMAPEIVYGGNRYDAKVPLPLLQPVLTLHFSAVMRASACACSGIGMSAACELCKFGADLNAAPEGKSLIGSKAYNPLSVCAPVPTTLICRLPRQ